MRSMKLLEERYGSLVEANKQIALIVMGEHPTPHTEMLAMLPMALLHEGVVEDDLADLAPSRYPDLLRALIDAINEGFPDVAGKAQPGDQGESAASPGATSTTPLPSGLVAAETSSGA